MKINSNIRMKLFNLLVSDSINHIYLILLIFVLTLANLTHGFIGSFSRYGADDYCTAGKLNSLGFWNAQSFWYNNWTGRYSFTFFVSIFELFESSITSVLPYFFIILLYLSFYVFFNTIFKKIEVEKQRLFSLLFTSLVVFIILFTVPNIRQNLYWMTGSTTYFLPIIIFFLFLSLLIKHENRNGKNITSYVFMFFGVFLFAFILSGFSEVFSVLQILFFGFAHIFVFFIKKKFVLNRAMFIALLGAISGLIVMVAAPGNSIRLSQHLPHPDIFELFFNSLVLSSKFTFLWFVKQIYIIWPISTMVVLLSSFLKTRREVIVYLKKYKYTLIFFLIISCLILVYVSFLPSIWATAKPPVERVLIFPVVILTLLCISLSILVGIILRDFLNECYFPGCIFVHLIIAITFIYFLVGVPFYQARVNYANRAEARTFASKWEEREIQIYEQIKTGDSDLVVPMIPKNILDVEHIQTNPDHWINVCAAEYYGVTQISAK